MLSVDKVQSLAETQLQQIIKPRKRIRLLPVGAEQKYIKEILDYNSETGIFTWIKSSGNATKAGDIAGYKNKNGRVLIMINSKFYQASRLAWLYIYGLWPKHHIDHINHKADDNRLVNLRDVKMLDNNKNYSMYRTNTSGYTGIYFDKKRQGWKISIHSNGKTTYRRRKYLSDAIQVMEQLKRDNGFHVNHGMNVAA